jgi:impB/mucB/samB family
MGLGLGLRSPCRFGPGQRPSVAAPALVEGRIVLIYTRGLNSAWQLVQLHLRARRVLDAADGVQQRRQRFGMTMAALLDPRRIIVHLVSRASDTGQHFASHVRRPPQQADLAPRLAFVLLEVLVLASSCSSRARRLANCPDPYAPQDYDCFYASVVEAHQPSLRGKPLAVQQKQVGGSPLSFPGCK